MNVIVLHYSNEFLLDVIKFKYVINLFQRKTHFNLLSSQEKNLRLKRINFFHAVACTKCIPYLVILKDIPRIYGLKKFQAHLLLKFNVDLHFTKFKTLTDRFSISGQR